MLYHCNFECNICDYVHVVPPQCITNSAREQGISSSLDMPDKVLNFVKDHFLMDSVIRSQPLLLKRNIRYTQIAVHRVQPAKKAYNVLFIGTGKSTFVSRSVAINHKESNLILIVLPDDGRLHKAINVKDKMHIIEEMVLFRDSQPVQHIELDTEKVRSRKRLVFTPALSQREPMTSSVNSFIGSLEIP